MTLIVGIIAKNGIILATDSRMTSGNPTAASTQSNDTVRKIFKITDHCAMGISGSGEIGATLIESFRSEINQLNNQLLTVTDVVKKFRSHCCKKYEFWFKRLPVESNRIPNFNVLICGYANLAKGKLSDPKIIRMGSYTQFAPMTTTTGFATLGIPTIANYLLNRLYFRNEINLDQALSLAAFCIIETESQDGRVGGNLQAAILSHRKNFREINKREINNLTTRCQEILKNSFQVSFYKPRPKEEPLESIVSGPKSPQQDAVRDKSKQNKHDLAVDMLPRKIKTKK